MDRVELPTRHGGDRVAEALHAQHVEVVFTLCGGHISPILAASKARGIRIVDGVVASMEVAEDGIVGVRLADESVIGRDAVVVSPRMNARAAFLAPLGIQTAEHPAGSYIPADATGRTEVSGVWVAGNVTDLTAQVGASAAAGAFAGAQINADLVAEETREAVAAFRSAA